MGITRIPTVVLALALAGGATAQQNPSASSRLDGLIQARWKDVGAKAAPPAGDAEFLRRITLDLIGTIPAGDDVVEFLKDTRPDKRARKIDQLLDSPEYAAYWAEMWCDILVGYGTQNNRGDSRRGLYAWLRDEAFAANMPYDRIARSLITARGVNVEAGPANFLLAISRQDGGGPNAIAGKVSRVFMATHIACAQCHDHPFDRYTQDDFYGTVAFFVRTKNRKVDNQNQQDQRYEIYDSPKGEAEYGEGKTKKTVAPIFLDGGEPDKSKERRDEFARLLCRPENLLFAKAVVNRYWYVLFGRGLVEPIDDFSGKNKPSHPELLETLAKEFVAHGHDLKWLIRTIANSKTYQLSSRKPGPDAPAEKFFAYAETRALTPEQLFNALMEALGAEDNYTVRRRKGDVDEVSRTKYEILRRFRFTFGDDEMADRAEFDGTIPQALMLMNGDVLNSGITAKNNRLDLILRMREQPRERLELVFVSVLGRLPADREAAGFLAHIQKTGNKREAYEDLYWVLLNSSEFLFNH